MGISNIKYISTSLCFSINFTNENNLSHFLFAFLYDVALPKWGQLLKNLLQREQILQELVSIQKGDKNVNGKVASPESVLVLPASYMFRQLVNLAD